MSFQGQENFVSNTGQFDQVTPLGNSTLVFAIGSGIGTVTAPDIPDDEGINLFLSTLSGAPVQDIFVSISFDSFVVQPGSSLNVLFIGVLAASNNYISVQAVATDAGSNTLNVQVITPSSNYIGATVDVPGLPFAFAMGISGNVISAYVDIGAGFVPLATLNPFLSGGPDLTAPGALEDYVAGFIVNCPLTGNQVSFSAMKWGPLADLNATPVPDIVGDSVQVGQTTLADAGDSDVTFTLGNVVPVFVPNVAPGIIQTQNPAAGTLVSVNTSVDVTLSAFSAGLDIDATVISQYANSPILLALVHNMEVYFDQNANMAQFYSYVWNVLSAVGFGLDIWGRIVGIGRALMVSGIVITLDDEQFLPLILAKALANIISTTIPALNQLLQNLFTGQRAYVQDLGNMQMSYIFEFILTPLQFAIVNNSGIFPHPAGVQSNVVNIPADSFGFSPGPWLGLNQGTINPG